jgi:hypothetical protein
VADYYHFEIFDCSAATGVSHYPFSPSPLAFSLAPPAPNPFNPNTKLSFSLPENSYVLLSIYDNLGREVLKLIEGWKPAGNFQVPFNAGSLPSGIYFARFTAGDFQQTQKMILIK